MDMIEVYDLTKHYGGFKAVDNVSFNVKEGEIFGFLGPNGAGKTTTIKAILHLVNISSGEIKINGLDVKKNEKEVKRNIGYLPENVAFYDNLTALQNLYFYADIKNASRAECMSLLEEFRLKDSAYRRVGKFSKGMIQRLGMIQAILGEPRLLILDEPTAGLDPRGVVLIRKKIQELNRRGVTIFLSSHILSEVQEICDRVGIINRGVLIAQDTVQNLSKKLDIKPKISIELEKISDQILDAIKKVEGVEGIDVLENTVDVICSSGVKAKVVVAIENAGGKIINLRTREPSLEEVFMKYTEEGVEGA
ncbi:MAG: ABC transporter ATP-binding protein [Thermoplasmata archaeon]|nr:MAG: ABC transporter ATP-binding protein [Thermoplasmata archaeon]